MHAQGTQWSILVQFVDCYLQIPKASFLFLGLQRAGSGDLQAAAEGYKFEIVLVRNHEIKEMIIRRKKSVSKKKFCIWADFTGGMKI